MRDFRSRKMGFAGHFRGIRHSEPTFLRKLRNAIAHSHIKVDSQNTEYTFWNVNRSKKIDFEVSATTVKLSCLLTGLGTHFSSVQRRNR